MAMLDATLCPPALDQPARDVHPTAAGTPDFIRNDPKVVAAYLGVEEDAVDAAEAELPA